MWTTRFVNSVFIFWFVSRISEAIDLLPNWFFGDFVRSVATFRFPEMVCNFKTTSKIGGCFHNEDFNNVFGVGVKSRPLSRTFWFMSELYLNCILKYILALHSVLSISGAPVLIYCLKLKKNACVHADKLSLTANHLKNSLCWMKWQNLLSNDVSLESFIYFVPNSIHLIYQRIDPVGVFGDRCVDRWFGATIRSARAGSHAHQLIDAVTLANQRTTRVTL